MRLLYWFFNKLSGIEFNIINDRGGNDLNRVQFALVAWDRSLEGKTLHDWAMREGLESTPETGAGLPSRTVQRDERYCWHLPWP